MVNASEAKAPQESESSQDIHASNKKITKLNELSGLWNWDLEEKMRDEESGGMLLLAAGDGLMEGYSILTSATRNTESEDQSVYLGLTGFPLMGKVHKEENGDITFSFDMEIEEEGLTISNKTNGRYLAKTDTIEATTSSEKSVDGEDTTISYDWTAKRAEEG